MYSCIYENYEEERIKAVQECRNKIFFCFVPEKLGHISGSWDWLCIQYKYWFHVSRGLSSVPSAFLAFHHATCTADYKNNSFRVAHLAFRTQFFISVFILVSEMLALSEMPALMATKISKHIKIIKHVKNYNYCMCVLLVVIFKGVTPFWGENLM